MTTITTRVNNTTELSYEEGDDNVAQDIGTKPGAYEADLDDNRTTYECTGTWDFTLPVADDMIYDGVNSSMADDYEVTVTNVGTGDITAITQGADTLDGVAATGDFVIPRNESYTFKVNAGKDGFIVKDCVVDRTYAGNINGTSVGSSQLPAGWTVNDDGTGQYTITHSLGTTRYSATATVVAGSPYIATIALLGNNTITFKVYTRLGVLVDAFACWIIKKW